MKSTFRLNRLTVSLLLGALTITLKLTGVINWSWGWVLLPLWAIPAGILATLIAALLLATLYRLSQYAAHYIESKGK